MTATLDTLRATAEAKLDAYLSANPDAPDADRLAVNVFRAFPVYVYAPSKVAKIANAAFDSEVSEDAMERAMERLRSARVLRFYAKANRNLMERYYEVAL